MLFSTHEFFLKMVCTGHMAIFKKIIFLSYGEVRINCNGHMTSFFIKFVII